MVERLNSSTLLDDRRDACRALKSLSRKLRVEVGAQALDSIIHVLKTDSADTEITAYALETLCNITSKDLGEGKFCRIFYIYLFINPGMSKFLHSSNKL